ncbi:MAG: hypothetical protein BGO16_03020 [Nitrobacter sp. 62-23]|nr:MAG: hypothetical protein BGO16_03020 [Nitrobacter sp. 62-23]
MWCAESRSLSHHACVAATAFVVNAIGLKRREAESVEAAPRGFFATPRDHARMPRSGHSFSMFR